MKVYLNRNFGPKNFLKFCKANYNKRMGITPTFVKKQEKIFKDVMRMNDNTDWMTLALTLQSDLFHEQLFSEITSDFKNERETKSKIKDMAGKAGLKSETIYDKYTQGFNEHLAVFWNETKEEILKQAETNPAILQADPEWMEKLKTQEGLMEYLDKKEVDFTPETAFNYPEINQLFLSIDSSNMTKTFSEMYFSGLFNEDTMRYGPHKSAMQNYLETFEEEVHQTANIVNEMWVSKLKSDTFNYIKLVLSEDFKKESLSYAKTLDNLRVDVGLVVTRDPVFLEAHKEDMDFGKYRRTFFKKNYYNIDKHLEEIEAFNDVSSDYWDVCSSQFKVNTDNKPNMRRWNAEKNAFDFYCSNSKHWSLVDPAVNDEKSIQQSSLERVYLLLRNKRTKQYEFPTMPLYSGDSFYDSKFRLFYAFSQDEFKLFHKNPYPIFQVTRDFHDYEKDDPKNKGLNGVRTFYYEAQHFRGAPRVFTNVKHPYDDFVVSSKRRLAEYVGKSYWEAVVPSLHEN